MSIEYTSERALTTEEFIDLLKRSTLSERRPVEDLACMKGMVENSNLLITAWLDGLLIGVSRSVTDFHYACYLSDLAVDSQYQKKGVGKKLMALTQQHLGPKCALILLAAPAANAYYPAVGFSHNPRCWVLDRDSRVTSGPGKSESP